MKRYLIAALLLLLSAHRGFAADDWFSLSPFDISTKQFAPGYYGNHPYLVFQGIGSKEVAKGKFETTQAFKIRHDKVWSKPLFGQVYMWSPLAFAATPSWSDYNPDTRKFQAHFALYKTTIYDKSISENSPEALVTTSVGGTDHTGSYEAQNAFGARVTVNTESATYYGFGVMNWKDFFFTDLGDNKFKVSLNLSVPPASAQRLEKSLRVLYVGYLTSPYRGIDYDGDWATYDSPYTSSRKFCYLCIRLKSIWFYDNETGFVYGKLSPKALK